VRVRWHPVAREELLGAAAFYKEQRAGLDEEFLASVQHAINLLLHFPDLGQEVEPDYRRMQVHRFPYSVIYRVRNTELQVKGIIHHRMDLHHWVDR